MAKICAIGSPPIMSMGKIQAFDQFGLSLTYFTLSRKYHYFFKEVSPGTVQYP